jgi:glucoamylase
MPSEASAGETTSLADWMDRQYQLSAAAMLQSISAVHLIKERPAFGQSIRPAKGSVLASSAIASYDPDPDYFFHWLRDSAIVIDALRTLIEDGTCGSEARDHVKDFLRFALVLGDQDGRALLKEGASPRAVDPDFQQYMRPAAELRAAHGDAVLGETRVNPDGTLDITKWARPQHDGPALRALAVLRLLRSDIVDDPAARITARALVETDLAFIHRRWAEPSFDIWEEELGLHYYTRLAQHAALADGAEWLDEIGDPHLGPLYRQASREIAQCLDSHWSAAKGFYLSRLGATAGSSTKELDIATILAVVHARRGEGPHSVLDPRAQATLTRLEQLFARDYRINESLPPGHGPAMGRYAGDRYYSGGAYYFATLGAAEFYYRLAYARARELRVVADPRQPVDRSDAVDALISRGDGFMAAVRAHTPASGELSEQFDQATGRQTSAKNLAWSHAAFVTATASRRAARSGDR